MILLFKWLMFYSLFNEPSSLTISKGRAIVKRETNIILAYTNTFIQIAFYLFFQCEWIIVSSTTGNYYMMLIITYFS